MYVCQWHIDIPFGQQKVVLDILQEWSEELASTEHAPRSRGRRLLVGHLGASASHIIHEHLFESLHDWESVHKSSQSSHSRQFAEELAPFIVPGSQKWIIFRIIE